MGSIRTEYYKNVVYPVYQFKYGLKYGYKVIKILRQLEKSQWLSHDEILAYQTKKLRSLIEHAYHNVPYYKEIMDEINIRPEDIKSVEDIKYLPILTKKKIRENYEKLISKDIRNRNITRASTGGSTGEPLKYVRDRDTLIWTEAASLRGMSWAKCRMGDVFIDFFSPDWPSRLGRIRGRVLNKFYYPAFAKDYELISYVRMIKKLKPFCLTGYPSNLYRIAAIFHKHKINDIEFPIIFSTSEMLYDFQRDFLENYFNGKVFDYYGCNEVGSIAYECEYHNKHISNERLIIETTDSEANQVIDSSGEITITDLDNYAMPFIRYKNGDAGIIANDVCRCRRYLTMIKRVEGRIQDFLRSSDGNYVPAIFFPTRFRDLNGIDQYQIIQKDINNITLKIVKNQIFSVKELEEMIQVIKKIIGNDVHINIEACEDIPLTRIGKTRLVISHVPVELF